MFPDDVGVSMFGRGKSAIALQIHYDNPDLVKGKKDSSGMRYVGYTSGLSPFATRVLHNPA